MNNNANLHDYRSLALSAAEDLEYPEWVFDKIRSAKTEDEISSIMSKARLSAPKSEDDKLIEDHIVPRELIDRFWKSKDRSIQITWRSGGQYKTIVSMRSSLINTVKRLGYPIDINYRGNILYLEKRVYK